MNTEFGHQWRRTTDYILLMLFRRDIFWADKTTPIDELDINAFRAKWDMQRADRVDFVDTDGTVKTLKHRPNLLNHKVRLISRAESPEVLFAPEERWISDPDRYQRPANATGPEPDEVTIITIDDDIQTAACMKRCHSAYHYVVELCYDIPDSHSDDTVEQSLFLSRFPDIPCGLRQTWRSFNYEGVDVLSWPQACSAVQGILSGKLLNDWNDASVDEFYNGILKMSAFFRGFHQWLSSELAAIPQGQNQRISIYDLMGGTKKRVQTWKLDLNNSQEFVAPNEPEHPPRIIRHTSEVIRKREEVEEAQNKLRGYRIKGK